MFIDINNNNDNDNGNNNDGNNNNNKNNNDKPYTLGKVKRKRTPNILTEIKVWN